MSCLSSMSPDINPLDFFLFGNLKSVVYKAQPDDIDEPTSQITAASCSIPVKVFITV